MTKRKIEISLTAIVHKGFNIHAFVGTVNGFFNNIKIEDAVVFDRGKVKRIRKL